MNCPHCPNFLCKLKSDYTRHLDSANHKHNETIYGLTESLHNLKLEHIWLENHRRKFKKVTREYISRTALPTHVYNTRELFVDIRDRYSPSRDKSMSHCNDEYFHNSFY